MPRPDELAGDGRLTGPWHQIKDTFQNNCLSCHSGHPHQSAPGDYLNAEAIEKAGSAEKTGGDVCYGCHGGRPWYRIAYPYARNPWPGHARSDARVGPATPAPFRNALPESARNHPTGRTLNHETDP